MITFYEVMLSISYATPTVYDTIFNKISNALSFLNSIKHMFYLYVF
ncbi:hypothetical protein DDI_0931 [Dickeya dianthicola RNS04.9]|nr:hypothetical protein DDI_0931 [Dickeya dianthicola RNS04.9]